MSGDQTVDVSDSEMVGSAFQQWRQWQLVTFTGADVNECSMQALVHCQQECTANDDAYPEKYCFVAENVLYQTV